MAKSNDAVIEVSNKFIRILDDILNWIVIIIGLLILLISIYGIIDSVLMYRNAFDKNILKYKPSLEEPLDHSVIISERQIGWICVFYTNIDYPLMQGKDNFEFLNIDPFGNFRMSGSIFLDSRNNSNLEDDYSIIYGHHMDYTAMFGSLDQYKEQEFFDEHRKGRIITRQKVYDYEIFAVAADTAGNRLLFDPEGRKKEEITDYLRDNSLIFYEPEEGRRIVSLSTCSGNGSMARLLVFGTIKEKE